MSSPASYNSLPTPESLLYPANWYKLTRPGIEHITPYVGSVTMYEGEGWNTPPTPYEYDSGPARSYTGSREAAPYLPQTWPIRDEVTPRLHASLWKQAEALSLPDHMTLTEGRDRPPKNLDEYRFVPVLPSDPRFLVHNLSSVHSNLLSSEGIRFEYGERSDGTPFMDARFGLGLAFRNRLVALCAGGLAYEGPILQQLQDVSSKTPPPDASAKELRSFRYANGLYSGLDWKITLARGWCSLMSRALPDILPGTEGMTVWMQSAENNTWVKRLVYDRRQATGRYTTDYECLARLSQTYNGTARKLGGGACSPQTHNIPLPEAFSVGRAA